MFEDSFHQLRMRSAEEMGGRLQVNFHGEEGEENQIGVDRCLENSGVSLSIVLYCIVFYFMVFYSIVLCITAAFYS